MTRLVDPHADLILVGDSLAMTVYGMASTVGVTQEMMIAHGRAVARAASHACVVVDLPFGSYEEVADAGIPHGGRSLWRRPAAPQ